MASRKGKISVAEKAEKAQAKSQNFAESIASNFCEENQVVESKLSILGENISIFYVESLIDKVIFSQGILSPIEKVAQSETQSGSESSPGAKQPQNNVGQANAQGKKSQNKNQGKASQAQTQGKKSQGNSTGQGEDIIDKIKAEIVSISGTIDVENVKDAVLKILSGYAVISSESRAICCPIFGAEKRGIEEPPTSRVVKGPREGFVEDVTVNLGLIRKRLRTTDLKIEDTYVGKKTCTHISLVYLDGIAKPEVLDGVKQRISAINIDAIIDSYYVESFLEDKKLKFFRRVGNTEKPDIFCAKLLEGRVGILVDGSPIALTVPFILFEDLQSAEDYYNVPAMASFARLMRIMGLVMAILIPGVYVALQSFNYRILPINFLIALLSSIEGLSTPPLIEILIVLLLFEIITEASLQMPSSLGMALSIIGALALGNTAVDAGLISAPSIVIVAISSVAIYIIPGQISETRLLRLLFTVVGGITGLYGILISFLMLTIYLTSMTSFGVPYMIPLSPSIRADKKDSFIKQDIQAMKTRPALISGENKVRQRESEYELNETESEENQESNSGGKKTAKSQQKGNYNGKKSEKSQQKSENFAQNSPQNNSNSINSNHENENKQSRSQTLTNSKQKPHSTKGARKKGKER